MLPAHIEDFVRGCLADNRMAVMSLEAGESVTPADVIHLASEAQALHMVVALHCRGLESIEEYRSLWNAAYEFFDAACRIWADAPSDGELVSAHRALLIHLREMTQDRVEFYTVGASDRGAYQARKACEQNGQHNEN